MSRQGRLGGYSPGQATAIGAADSHWQWYLLSPESPLSSGQSAWPELRPCDFLGRTRACRAPFEYDTVVTFRELTGWNDRKGSS